ncbi:MAG TPA: Piwi domain-containing protein [Anaerolineae bacterium]|nr:Piwi domain-containing protein [Anaerolineae bacterium]
MNLFGKALPDVQLRFNSALKFATDPSPRNGIRRFGPYDASLSPQRQVNCGLIYFPTLKAQRDLFVNGLLNGEGTAFPGFSQWFRLRMSFDPRAEKQVAQEGRALRQAAEDLAAQDCDLVFVLVAERSEWVYRECKSTLLSNGIPCQFVTLTKLQNPTQRPWILANIALASYAKIGRTPWVVAEPPGRHELVMGISRAQDEAQNYVVGFVTLFNQEGDYLLLHSKTPVVSWDEYVKGLEDLVIDAYQEYESNFDIPSSLVIHFHKRPGGREIDAVTRALNQMGKPIPYSLIHLNEFSAFRLFDTAHSSYIPPSGLQVNLSRYRALLLLDGRENDIRNRMGVPNVWDISMDKRSTMSPDEFPRLVRQVHRFAKVNWRGFNSRSVPVTINYSKLICDQMVEVGLKSWASIASQVKLRDKAWFL